MSKKLGQLLEKMEYELVQGSLDTEVTDLAYDSRKITEGMLFVAIAGTVVDGHKFIPDVPVSYTHLKARREGKSVYYSLADGHVRTIIAQGMDHIKE